MRTPQITATAGLLALFAACVQTEPAGLEHTSQSSLAALDVDNLPWKTSTAPTNGFAGTDVLGSTELGRLAGGHSVRPDGGFEYGVPLAVPPGDMAPELNLSYDSRAANGYLGVGFKLDVPGMAISTCGTSSGAHNKAPFWAYCLGDQKLKLVRIYDPGDSPEVWQPANTAVEQALWQGWGNAGEPRWMFAVPGQPELTIIYFDNGDSGVFWVRDGMTVRLLGDPSGILFTENSEVAYHHQAYHPEVVAMNRHGDLRVTKYHQAEAPKPHYQDHTSFEGHRKIEWIAYGIHIDEAFTTAGAILAPKLIHFKYGNGGTGKSANKPASPRVDPLISSRQEHLLVVSDLLESITMVSRNQRLWRYDLAYEWQSGLSQLERISECFVKDGSVSCGDSYLKLNYSQLPSTVFNFTNFIEVDLSFGGKPVEKLGYADITGDGKSELIAVRLNAANTGYRIDAYAYDPQKPTIDAWNIILTLNPAQEDLIKSPITYLGFPDTDGDGVSEIVLFARGQKDIWYIEPKLTDLNPQFEIVRKRTAACTGNTCGHLDDMEPDQEYVELYAWSTHSTQNKELTCAFGPLFEPACKVNSPCDSTWICPNSCGACEANPSNDWQCDDVGPGGPGWWFEQIHDGIVKDWGWRLMSDGDTKLHKSSQVCSDTAVFNFKSSTRGMATYVSSPDKELNWGPNKDFPKHNDKLLPFSVHGQSALMRRNPDGSLLMMTDYAESQRSAKDYGLQFRLLSADNSELGAVITSNEEFLRVLPVVTSAASSDLLVAKAGETTYRLFRYQPEGIATTTNGYLSRWVEMSDQAKLKQRNFNEPFGVADFDGDGLADLFQTESAAGGTVQKIYFQNKPLLAPQARLLQQISDRHGVLLTVKYAAGTDDAVVTNDLFSWNELVRAPCDTSDTNAMAGEGRLRCVDTATPVVNSITTHTHAMAPAQVNEQFGSIAVDEYRYKNFRRHSKGGDLGPQSVTITRYYENGNNQRIDVQETTNEYTNTCPAHDDIWADYTSSRPNSCRWSKGLLKRTVSRPLNQGTLKDPVETTLQYTLRQGWDHGVGESIWYTRPLVKTTGVKWQAPRTILSSWNAERGYALGTQTTDEDGFKTVENMTVVPATNGFAMQFPKPASHTVCHTYDGTTECDETRLFWSDDWKLDRVEQSTQGDPRVVTSTVAYVPGNLKSKLQSVTVSDGGASLPHTTTLVYDNSGEFVTGLINAEGQLTMETAFDRDMGMPLASRQRGNDLLITRLSYDALGRIIKVLPPVGQPTYTSRNWVQNHPQIKAAIHVYTPDGADTTSYVDRYGRPVKVAQKTEAGDIVSEQYFNERGLLAYSSSPHAAQQPEALTSYKYDGSFLARIIAPNDAMTQFGAYWSNGELWKSTTSPEGNSTREIRSPAGRLIKSLNANQHATCYEYRVRGLVKSIRTGGDRASCAAQNGHETTFNYDVRGVKNYTWDSAASATLLETDAFGRINNLKNSVGDEWQVTERDVMGRVRQQSTPFGSYTYEYEDGLLKSISGPEASDAYVYDGLRRLNRHERIIDGISYATIIAYSPNGRVKSTTLPAVDGFQFGTKPEYDTYGLVRSMHDLDDNLIYKILDRTALGQPINVLLGNGVTDTTYYDATTNQPVMRQSSNPGGMLQFQQVMYDLDGRKIFHKDWITQQQESMLLDPVGQLLKQTTSNGDISVERLFSYDNLGNMIFDSTRSAMQFSYDRTKILEIPGLRTFQYDQAGNTTFIDGPGDDDVSIQYLGDRAIEITRGDATAQFAYHGDALVRRVLNGSTRIYAGGVEVVSPTGETNPTVAEYVIPTPVGTLQVTRDLVSGTTTRAYQHEGLATVGSIGLNTDSGGNALGDTPAYGAFGESMSGVDWLQSIEDANAAGLKLGFSGMDREESARLGVNIVGWRPFFEGRFLQPDPLIAGLYGNAYSYANNNPFDYWDPTGLSPCDAQQSCLPDPAPFTPVPSGFLLNLLGDYLSSPKTPTGVDQGGRPESVPPVQSNIVHDGIQGWVINTSDYDDMDDVAPAVGEPDVGIKSKHKSAVESLPDFRGDWGDFSGATSGRLIDEFGVGVDRMVRSWWWANRTFNPVVRFSSLSDWRPTIPSNVGTVLISDLFPDVDLTSDRGQLGTEAGPEIVGAVTMGIAGMTVGIQSALGKDIALGLRTHLKAFTAAPNRGWAYWHWREQGIANGADLATALKKARRVHFNLDGLSSMTNLSAQGRNTRFALFHRNSSGFTNSEFRTIMNHPTSAYFDKTIFYFRGVPISPAAKKALREAWLFFNPLSPWWL